MMAPDGPVMGVEAAGKDSTDETQSSTSKDRLHDDHLRLSKDNTNLLD